MKKSIRILVLAFALIMLLATPVGAFNSFQTYTYSINGDPLNSPDAYIPVGTYNSKHMAFPDDVTLNDPRDMVIDEDMNVYIADAGANSIVVLDRYYKHKFTITSFTNTNNAENLFASKYTARTFTAVTQENRVKS